MILLIDYFFQREVKVEQDHVTVSAKFSDASKRQWIELAWESRKTWNKRSSLLFGVKWYLFINSIFNYNIYLIIYCFWLHLPPLSSAIGICRNLLNFQARRLSTDPCFLSPCFISLPRGLRRHQLIRYFMNVALLNSFKPFPSRVAQSFHFP